MGRFALYGPHAVTRLKHFASLESHIGHAETFPERQYLHAMERKNQINHTECG